MEKKNIVGLALVLLMFSVISVNGLKEKGYLHRNDYYSVTYDSEGDAVVASKLILYNNKHSELREIKLELPSEKVVIYNLVQEGEYGIDKEPYGREYPRHEEYYYPIEYEIERTSSATLLTLHLSESIEPQNEGVILLLYKIPRNTKVGPLGTHRFDFETIIDKNAALIQNVRVAVGVQPGLHLKSGKGEVEYKKNYLQIKSMEFEKGRASSKLQEFSRDIAHAEGLVKKTSNLDPYESFHVRGEFADSWWKLHYGEFLIVMLILAGIVIASKVAWGKIGIEFGMPEGGIFSSKNKSYSARGIRSCLFGFLCALFVTAVWFCITFLFKWIETFSYSTTNMLIPLVLLAAIISIIVALFGPAMAVGIKYGGLEGVLTFIFTGIWLLAFVVIIGLILYEPSPLVRPLTEVR